MVPPDQLETVVVLEFVAVKKVIDDGDSEAYIAVAAVLESEVEKGMTRYFATVAVVHLHVSYYVVVAEEVVVFLQVDDAFAACFVGN